MFSAFAGITLLQKQVGVHKPRCAQPGSSLVCCQNDAHVTYLYLLFKYFTVAQEVVKKHVRAGGAILCQSQSDASLFIVNSIGDPGNRIKWYACLLGRCIMDWQTAIGGVGPLVSYKPAVERTLRVWISSGICKTHPLLHSTLQVATRSCSSKWQCLSSKAEFLRIRESCAAICTKEEIANDPILRRSKMVFTKERFLQHITKVSSRRLGLAGMCPTLFVNVFYLLMFEISEFQFSILTGEGPLLRLTLLGIRGSMHCYVLVLPHHQCRTNDCM